MPKEDRYCHIKIEPGHPKGLIFDMVKYQTWSATPDRVTRVGKSPYASRAFIFQLADKVFLVRSDDKTVVELSTGLAEIWEALCMRVNGEDMKRHFCTKYEIEDQTWLQNLEQAMEIFTELGFFKEEQTMHEEIHENFFMRNTLL